MSEDKVLKECPWCKSDATNPLLHSNNCYISLMASVFQGHPSPPEDVVIKTWNSRPSEWVQQGDAPFEKQGFSEGERFIIKYEDGHLFDTTLGESKPRDKGIAAYAKFVD